MSGPTFNVSKEHQAILLNNWAAVKPDMMTHGRNILLIFFKDHPQHIKYFPFKNLSLEAMGEDQNFKNHGLRVVRELGSWLDFLNNEQALMVALKRNIQSHKKRNIERAAYNDLADSILKYLGETFGSSFTLEMRHVWQETLGKIFKVLTDGACGTSSK